MLHANTATIDGVWSCVGSTNLDRRSFLHNNEVDAAILGREFAHLERWAARPDGLKLKEWAARLWEYWL